MSNLHSQYMNQATETNLIDRFKKCYKYFPSGELIKTNPPATDFILKTNDSTIGIELTEALHSEQARQISADTYNFTNGVVMELRNKLPFTFAIDIDLSPTIPIPKTNRPKLITQVVEQCVKEFSNLQPNECRDIEDIGIDLSGIPVDRPEVLNMMLGKGYRNLPPGIKGIKIIRIDGISESWNWQGEGGAIPNFTAENLASILEKKHKKLSQYTSCSQYWLIITEGNYYTGSFKKILIETSVESLFDKVFLFRSVEEIVIELK
jgi:hypothetical protein